VNARDEILARIQRSLAAVPRSSTGDHAAIQRSYVQAGKLDVAAKLNYFEESLREYNAEVYRCSESQLPETIARAMNATGHHCLLVTDEIPKECLPPAPFEFSRDDNLSYEDLDRSEGVLTACTIAIAMTGTIILRHSKQGGRRALTLIPDYHLCIVRASQVLETVPEAIRAIHAAGSSPNGSPLTTISGPSATADIEMTRIKGVHGPRVINVILVS
jgi:L-lactate dehydrogenase complex protein LldG